MLQSFNENNGELALFYLFQRLGSAAEEMEYGEGEGNFDAIVINEDLGEAYQQFKQVLQL